MQSYPIRIFGFVASWYLMKGILAAAISVGAVVLGFMFSVHSSP